MTNFILRINFYLIILIFLSINDFSQEYESGKINIIISDENYLPIYSNRSLNLQFNELLDDYKVFNVEQPYYFAKTQLLKNLYQLTCNSDENDFYNALETFNSTAFYSIEKYLKCYQNLG